MLSGFGSCIAFLCPNQQIHYPGKNIYFGREDLEHWPPSGDTFAPCDSAVRSSAATSAPWSAPAGPPTSRARRRGAPQDSVSAPTPTFLSLAVQFSRDVLKIMLTFRKPGKRKMQSHDRWRLGPNDARWAARPHARKKRANSGTYGDGQAPVNTAPQASVATLSPRIEKLRGGDTSPSGPNRPGGGKAALWPVARSAVGNAFPFRATEPVSVVGSESA